MSKHRVAVLKVVSSQWSVTAAAAEYGISRGHGDESPQRRLLPAPDPGAQLGVDEVALVDLAAALPAHGHFGRRERGHELVASEQLADEHNTVAAVGLDDPECST